MKANAKEYLRDARRRDAGNSVGLFSALTGELATHIYRMRGINRALKSNERINVKQRNGFLIQITDRREQYEERKKRAELAGMGF